MKFWDMIEVMDMKKANNTVFDFDSDTVSFSSAHSSVYSEGSQKNQ